MALFSGSYVTTDTDFPQQRITSETMECFSRLLPQPNPMLMTHSNNVHITSFPHNFTTTVYPNSLPLFDRTSTIWRLASGSLPPEEMEYQKLVQKDEEEILEDVNRLTKVAVDSAEELEQYSLEEVLEARQIAAQLILSQDRVEEMIMKFADEGKLTPVLLQVIKNRLNLAKSDNEEDAIMCLDLLYRRIETERQIRSASPSLRLLQELLHVSNADSEREWESTIEKRMREAFVPEVLSFVHQSVDSKAGEQVYRVDFITEVDELLFNAMQSTPAKPPEGMDDAAMASRLKHGERVKAVEQVKKLRDIAIHLRW